MKIFFSRNKNNNSLSFGALHPTVKIALQKQEINKKSFVPTPETLADIMVKLAELNAGDRVLEPQAGQGHLIDRIQRKIPGICIEAVEKNPVLAAVLKLKHNVQLMAHDIMEFNPGQIYTKILTNPPFICGYPIKHGVHCFDNLLRPNGLLVSIVPDYVFKAPNPLLELIIRKNVCLDIINLGKEAFLNSDIPAKVKTSIIVLKKPSNFFKKI